MLLDSPTSPRIIPQPRSANNADLPGDRPPGRRRIMEYQRVALSGYCLLRHDDDHLRR